MIIVNKENNRNTLISFKMNHIVTLSPESRLKIIYYLGNTASIYDNVAQI